MLHRHHYMPNIVTSNEVQEVDDGPAKKRRKLADRLDGLIEPPKASPVDGRLAFVGTSEIAQQPIAGTSRETTQARRSPPLRRHNSLPTRASAATNEVRNHFGYSSLPHSVADNAYPPTSSSLSDSRFRSGAVPETRLRGETSMPFMSSGSRSDHPVHASLHSSHVLRPSRDSSHSHYLPMEPPRLSTAYLNVPGVSVSHSGCSPACMSHSIQSSSPFVGNVSRPCPSASHLFPSFSAVGVVPAPVLAAEALPNYYGFLPGLSLPPSPITYHSSPHVTLPPYPVSQSSMMSATTPLITHEVDYILPPPPAAHSYPAHQTSSSRDHVPSHNPPPPPPYSLASSQVFLVDNALRQSQSSPYGSLLAVPFQSPLLDYRRRSDGHLPWSTAPLTAPAPPPSAHRPPVDPTQPLFVQHFLAMLETTLGAIHESSHSHHTYTASNLHNYEALLGLARQLSENKPKGMSKSDIDRLVTYQYAVGDNDIKRSTSDTSESQISCVVCMCDFSQRQRVRELPCQHIFHAKCIDKWLKTNRTCPLCRADALDLLNCDGKVTNVTE